MSDRPERRHRVSIEALLDRVYVTCPEAARLYGRGADHYRRGFDCGHVAGVWRGEGAGRRRVLERESARAFALGQTAPEHGAHEAAAELRREIARKLRDEVG